MYRRWGKRLLDLVLAVSALVLLSPLLALLYFLVRSRLGAPVLFRQPRPGENGRPFVLLKFRTMTDARDGRGDLLPDADRLTPLGRALRSTSLDELPEFVNVLRGEMSVVGPRPLLMRYLPYYRQRERMRFTVRPGITGWAQIHGRNEASWDLRFERDVWYVEHQSLWLDLKILALTVGNAVARRGVVTDPSSIMLNLDEERMGNRSIDHADPRESPNG